MPCLPLPCHSLTWSHISGSKITSVPETRHSCPLTLCRCTPQEPTAHSHMIDRLIQTKREHLSNKHIHLHRPLSVDRGLCRNTLKTELFICVSGVSEFLHTRWSSAPSLERIWAISLMSTLRSEGLKVSTDGALSFRSLLIYKGAAEVNQTVDPRITTDRQETAGNTQSTSPDPQFYPQSVPQPALQSDPHSDPQTDLCCTPDCR